LRARFFQGTGVALSDTYVRVQGETREERRLMDEEFFRAATELAPSIARDFAAMFNAIVLQSSELDAVNNALNSGASPEHLAARRSSSGRRVRSRLRAKSGSGGSSGAEMQTRLSASLVLAGCWLLPFSTCTQRGKTIVHIPLRDLPPWYAIVFCGLLALVLAQRFRPPASLSAVLLLSLQPPFAVGSGYFLWCAALFESPILGFYLSFAALTVVFVSALVEIVQRIRAWRKRKAPS